MKIDLYSDRAKSAVQSAQSLALAKGHQQLGPEHLLKVLLEEKDGLSRTLIQNAGGRPDAAEAGASRLPIEFAGYCNPGPARTPISQFSEKTIQAAKKKGKATT